MLLHVTKWRNPRIPLKDTYLTMALTTPEREEINAAAEAEQIGASTFARRAALLAARARLAEDDHK